MVELATIDLFLDVLIKIMVLLFAGYTLFLLRNLNNLMRRAEASMESVEHTAEEVSSLIRWGRILPFVGGRDE